MRAWSLFLVVVLSMVVAGCGGKKNADAAEVIDPIPTESASDAQRPVIRLPYNHTEVFSQQGNVVVGTRGYSHICGGLSENGINGYDAITWTWELPAKVISETRLSITSITMTVGTGEYGQVEAFLFSPDGKELGRAAFAGIGDNNQTLTLKAPLAEGDYEVNVRVCGPDTAYRVKAEARYDE